MADLQLTPEETAPLTGSSEPRGGGCIRCRPIAGEQGSSRKVADGRQVGGWVTLIRPARCQGRIYVIL